VLYRDRKQSKSTRWKGDGILHVFDSGLARLENDDGESMGHAQKLGSFPLEEGTLLFMGDWQLQIVARSAPLSANTSQGGEPRTTVSEVNSFSKVREPYNSPINTVIPEPASETSCDLCVTHYRICHSKGPCKNCQDEGQEYCSYTSDNHMSIVRYRAQDNVATDTSKGCWNCILFRLKRDGGMPCLHKKRQSTLY
jgi:hypothetical protein